MDKVFFIEALTQVGDSGEYTAWEPLIILDGVPTTDFLEEYYGTDTTVNFNIEELHDDGVYATYTDTMGLSNSEKLVDVEVTGHGRQLLKCDTHLAI